MQIAILVKLWHRHQARVATLAAFFSPSCFSALRKFGPLPAARAGLILSENKVGVIVSRHSDTAGPLLKTFTCLV